MKLFLTTLFSFESVFVLFLFAGKYKNDPRFAWVPIDLTVFFLGLSVALGVWVLYKRRGVFRQRALRLAGLFLAFLTYAAVSLLWTPSSVYAAEKVGYLLVLTLWPFLACTLVIGDDLDRFKRFAMALAALSVWFTVETFLAFLASTMRGNQLAALGITYLGIGRVIGPAAIIILVYGIAIERRASLRLVAVLAFAVAVAALLLLGGRGPFLATVLPLLIPLYYGLALNPLNGTVRIRKYARTLLLLVAAGSVAAVAVGSSQVLSTIRRLLLLLESFGRSASLRVQMYGDALEIWAANPVFGAGVGSWPVLAGFGDQKMYPHNMILEVLAEFGLVGFLLFAFPFVYALWNVLRFADPRRHPWTLLALMLFANAFVNAMFTGDLSDNRVVFALLGFLVARFAVAPERTPPTGSTRPASPASQVRDAPSGAPHA